MPEVLVVGAGLAGLATALHLHRAGVDVALYEAADGVGGRVQTRVVDGFRCDRGFQVLDSAYPELARVVDLAGLDLHPFDAGALVVHGGERHRLRDPRRHPRTAAATALDRLLPLAQKVRLGGYTAWAALAPAGSLRGRADRSTDAELSAVGLAGPATERFLRPFLSGVLLERDLATSARLFRLLWRSFARGDQALPAAGMRALPEAIAGQLPPGCVTLGARVESIEPGAVTVGGRRLTATEVVVAVDPPTAGALLPDLGVPAMKGVTTVHYAVAESPLRERLLLLDADRPGPLTSTAVLTETAPSYSADGRALVSASVLGPLDEPGLRGRLAELYATGTGDWEVIDVAEVPAALPELPPGSPLRRQVRLAPGLLVAGDHRDTPSIQGALVSGRRAAAAVLAARGAPGRGAAASG